MQKKDAYIKIGEKLEDLQSEFPSGDEIIPKKLYLGNQDFALNK